MRFPNCIILLFAILSPAISAAAAPNSNYPLYSLQNIVAWEVSQDARTLFTIEQDDSGSIFVRRDLSTGDELLNVHLNMSQTYFMNTVIVDEDIYVFHVRALDREKQLFETSILKIDSNSGHVNGIYKSEELLGIAERFYVTGNGLLLTEKRGNRPYLFSLETQNMTAVNLNEDYRIRSFDLENNCAVIIQQSNFGTKFVGRGDNASYTEGDGSLLDVYLCDFSDDFNLTKIGQYQPGYVISENREEAFLPHFIIENSDYAWVAPSFMVNRFPINPGSLIGDTMLYSAWESLVGYDRITEISFVGDNYVLAGQFSETGQTALVVFDIKNPRLDKPETVAENDRDRIESLFRGQATTEKRILDPEILSRIFAVKFFVVDLVTTKVDSSDGGVMTSTSTESFTAVAQDTVYSVLKRNEELVAYVADGFVLNENSAALFQDALDVLFPMGHFARKHKMFYQEDGLWIFVRDESFGEKVGIIVEINEDGGIVGVGSEGAISKKE